MSSAAVKFDDLEVNTYSALARTSGLRKYVQDSGLNLSIIFYTQFCARGLKRLNKDLTDVNLEDFLGEDASSLVEEISLLHKKLNYVVRAAEAKGLMKNVFFRFFFQQIQSSTEEIGDFLETYYLSSNGEFHQMVDDAIKDLKPTKNPADWRSTLAKM